jgi:hypothetical protein
MEGKAMSEQNQLINLYSKEWEEKCKAAVEKCCQLDKKKIPEAEKWWRIKQLLKEMTRPERRRKPRPEKVNVEPIVETEAMRERRKLDFRSQEWTDKCKAISEKCAEFDNMKISEAEKLWRTKQLLKELVFTDRKRQANPTK